VIKPHPQADDEASLLKRAAAWPTESSLDELDGEALRRITASHGIDFATTLLFDRFQKSPRHAGFIRQIDALRGPSSQWKSSLDATIVIVPGALYVERPEMGGDGRLVREVARQLGLASDFVPLLSRGSAVENACLLAAWLDRQPPKPLILASLSKGGAEVKLALAASPQSFRHVMAWVNVCGPVSGSHMANWLLAGRVRTWLLRLQYRWQRRDFRFVTDLRRSPGAPMDVPLVLPSGMKMVSLVGFPLRRHFATRFSRFCHRTLATWGPNDGTVSLCDLGGWSGEVYPVWGTDHFFRPESMAKELIAAVIHHLEEERAGVTSRTNSSIKLCNSAL
jgi:hypothetical protein